MFDDAGCEAKKGDAGKEDAMTVSTATPGSQGLQSVPSTPHDFVNFDENEIDRLLADLSPNGVEPRTVEQLSTKFSESAKQELTKPNMHSGLDADISDLEFEMRNSLNGRARFGIRFSRAADGGKDAYYKSLPCDKKKDFRIDWGATLMGDLQKKKVKITSLTVEEREHGEYLPFGVIVEREGGWGRRSAVVAAAKYVSKCVKMSAPWCLYNPFTERTEYLFIRKMRVDIFSKYWALHSVSKSGVQQPPSLREAPQSGTGAKKAVANQVAVPKSAKGTGLSASNTGPSASSTGHSLSGKGTSTCGKGLFGKRHRTFGKRHRTFGKQDRTFGRRHRTSGNGFRTVIGKRYRTKRYRTSST